jgi:hypothetical protein
VVHWELREQMRKEDTQIIVQRAHEKHPGTSPRIISDRGSQFIAKDFEEFIDLIRLTDRRSHEGRLNSLPSASPATPCRSPHALKKPAVAVRRLLLIAKRHLSNSR